MSSLGEADSPYRAVFDAARDAMVVYTREGVVVEANAAACRTYGYTRKELIGVDAREAVHPNARPHFDEFLRVVGSGGEFRCETVDRRRDGTVFPIEVTGTSFTYNGQPHLLSVIRDITERERTEEARRKSEFRFQRLVEHSPQSTQLFHPDGRTRQVNRAFERLFGITLAELRDYNILRDSELVRLGVMPLMERAFAGEAVTIEPIPYVPDRGQYAGQTRWAGAYVYPVKDAAGRVAEVVLVHNDVTEQRLAEDALRHSEQRLRSLVEQSAAGIAQTDLTGRIVFANDRYREIVGYPMDELLRLRVHDLTHPDDLAETTQLVSAGAATGDEYAMEKRYVRKDGSVVWVAVSASVLRGAAGEPQSIMGVVIDISDRKRAEEQLRRNHDTFYNLIQNNPFGVYVVDADFRLREVSLGAQKVFSHVPRPLLGRDFNEVLRSVWTEPFASEALARFRHTLDTGEPYTAMRTVERRQDVPEVEAYDWRIERVVLPDGRFGVVCYFYDLTERQQLEAALRESEARRGAALAIANLGTFEWDVRTDAVTLDARSREIFGFAPGEGTRAEEVFARIDAADVPRVFAEAQASQRDLTRLETEYRINLPDGTVRTVVSINDAIVGLDGKAERMFGVFGDITARKQSEDALRRGAAQFRQLADAMPQMVWVTRPDGYHEYFNQRWYEFTGVPEGSTDGEGWNGLFHPDDQARAWERWRHSLATGEPYEIEYRLRHRSGAYRWTLGRALPIHDDQGEIERWFGTCTDIDAMKRLTAEREHLLEREQDARAAAEAANRAKDRFLAVLSHELRTPLTPVAMATTAMEMDPALPYEFREDVAMIRRNVELETRLIDDLLDLSRVTSGKLRLNSQPTHVHRVIRHVLETVSPELHEKQLHVERQCAARNDLVDADPARLQQVLWNLLRNAAKFTPAGGRVSIRTRNDVGQVVIEVADTGQGIAADVLPRIFDPFEQGSDEVTRRYGGMGLGLAIAKAVVDLHGGTIRAGSEGEGRGAEFTVALPLRAAAPTIATPENAEPPVGLERPLRLLLVEDHADTARTLARLLRLDGLDVQCAGTVAAAVELASAESFDVVVSDLGLPDGSGHDLMRRLRRDGPVRGIAMSGYGMEDDLRRSREAGFVEHLVKPVDLLQLRQAIRRVATA